MRDGLRIPEALMTILSNHELRWLNLKCFVLNGLLYLGTVLVYTAVTGMLFYGSKGDSKLEVTSSEVKENSATWQVILTAVQVCLDLIHNLGVMFIYIATLVLTTFWVQDIFDHLMDLKIKAIQERGDG